MTENTRRAALSAKNIAANAHTQRSLSKPIGVSPKSGEVIKRAVTTHRDALKRLADR